MRFYAILALAATVGFSAAQEGADDDSGPISNYFPPVCGNSCGPIVIQQKRCGEGSANQIQCICNWEGKEAQARQHIRGCEACIRINRPDSSDLQGECLLKDGAWMGLLTRFANRDTGAQRLLNACNFQPQSASLSGFAAPTAAPIAGAAAAAVMGVFAAM